MAYPFGRSSAIIFFDHHFLSSSAGLAAQDLDANRRRPVMQTLLLSPCSMEMNSNLLGRLDWDSLLDAPLPTGQAQS